MKQSALPGPVIPEDDIYNLWDELAAFPASATDDALMHMLQRVCDIADADTGYWLGAVRITSTQTEDALLGWRPRVIRYLHDHEQRVAMFRELVKEAESSPDASILAQIRHAGRFRAALKRDLLPPDWFGSEYNQRVNVSRGISDTMFITMPINDDCEAYIGLQRMHREDEPFSRDDLMRAARALRGLTWFQRRVFLSYGLMVSETALTPVERNVLSLLLTDKPEKLIAEELGQTHATTHTYVRQIYRKLGLKSRASLAALWLGHQAG